MDSHFCKHDHTEIHMDTMRAPTELERVIFQVVIKSLSGNCLVMQIPNGANGYDLGCRISAACGIAVEHQLLLCNGRRINMNRSLQSQGVGNDSTIMLTLELNGGAGRCSRLTWCILLMLLSKSVC